MNLNILYFILYFISLIFSVLGFYFLINYRDFQNIKLRKGVDAYLFGFMLFILFVLIKSLFFGQFLVQKLIPSFYVDFSNIVDYLVIFSDLTLAILISLFYLLSVIFFNDMEMKEKKLK